MILFSVKIYCHSPDMERRDEAVPLSLVTLHLIYKLDPPGSLSLSCLQLIINLPWLESVTASTSQPPFVKFGGFLVSQDKRTERIFQDGGENTGLGVPNFIFQELEHQHD